MVLANPTPYIYMVLANPTSVRCKARGGKLSQPAQSYYLGSNRRTFCQLWSLRPPPLPRP